MFSTLWIRTFIWYFNSLGILPVCFINRMDVPESCYCSAVKSHLRSSLSSLLVNILLKQPQVATRDNSRILRKQRNFLLKQSWFTLANLKWLWGLRKNNFKNLCIFPKVKLTWRKMHAYDIMVHKNRSHFLTLSFMVYHMVACKCQPQKLLKWKLRGQCMISTSNNVVYWVNACHNMAYTA